MKRRQDQRISRFLLAFSAALFFGLPGFSSLGQENLGKGRISGMVVDENGAAVENALIVAESMRSQTKLDSQSDNKGRFVIAGLGTGMWRVTASKSGYTKSFVEMDVKQLSTNPPITFTLKKITGVESLTADKESMLVFEQGNALLGQGDYDEALRVFEAFAAKYPEVYQVHLNTGTCYFKKGELDKAEAEFKIVLDRALEAHGDYKKDAEATMRAFTGLGELGLRRGDFDAAQKYFSQALEISPQDEAAAYTVGEVLFSHQKIDEAIKFLELAIQIKPDWSKPYLKLGYVYLNKGDLGKSLEAFQKFVLMDPENPEVPQVKNIVATIEKMKQ